MKVETARAAADPIQIDYVPFRQQIDFHLSDASEKVLIAGVRGGKTRCLAMEMVDAAIVQPGYADEDVRRREPYTMLVGAQTFRALDQVAKPEFIRSVPRKLLYGRFNAAEARQFVIGRRGLSKVLFRSTKNPEAWQGLKLYRAWLDEIGLMKEEAYHQARERLLDRRGTLLLSGTPRGTTWVKDLLYDRWRKEGNSDRFYFTRWHTADNPYVPREEIEHARRTMPPKYFARSFLADFTNLEGTIYEEWRDEIRAPTSHVIAAEDYTFILPSRTRSVGRGKNKVVLDAVVAGIDWGYAESHPGVMLVCGRTSQGVWYVLEESVASGLFHVGRTAAEDSWLARGLGLAVKWEVEIFYGDPSEIQAIKDLKRRGLPLKHARNEVKPGILAVATCMHVDPESGTSRLYVLDACRVLRDEIPMYRWKDGKEEPVKEADHCCDAMRYAIYTHETRSGFTHQTGWGTRSAYHELLT